MELLKDSENSFFLNNLNLIEKDSKDFKKLNFI